MNRRAFLKTSMFTGIWLSIQNALHGKAFAQTPKKGSVIIIAHTDDEVIWFLPWLHQIEKVIIASLPTTSGHLNIINKYASDYDALWQWGRGITSTQDYKERWLNPKLRQEFITEQSYDRILRDIIADPEVTEIYTHNPWGEYSHLHHKDVSKIVRKLAVEYGKDVLCPNMVVKFVEGGKPLATYESAYLPGLRQRTGYFEAYTFRKIRQFYLDEPINQASPINYWTWGGPDDYPRGYQKYFLAVSGGIDHTLDNSEIQQLVSDMPVFGI